MVPDPDLQLQIVVKALSETIAPALDRDNTVAQEQLHLAIGTLGIIRSRLPITRRFYRAIAGDTLALAQRLIEAGGDTAALSAAHRALTAALQDPALENEELEAERARLTGAITDHIASLGHPERKAMLAIVVEGTAKRIERERAWFIGSGFEPSADRIAPIAELI